MGNVAAAAETANHRAAISRPVDCGSGLHVAHGGRVQWTPEMIAARDAGITHGASLTALAERIGVTLLTLQRNLADVPPVRFGNVALSPVGWLTGPLGREHVHRSCAWRLRALMVANGEIVPLATLDPGCTTRATPLLRTRFSTARRLLEKVGANVAIDCVDHLGYRALIWIPTQIAAAERIRSIVEERAA